jgi:adenine-specific DNA-methyltransferase
MAHKTKLELTWIGKENRPRLEPRILLEDPEKSYHAKQRVAEDDLFDNRIIFGDNLLVVCFKQSVVYSACPGPA